MFEEVFLAVIVILIVVLVVMYSFFRNRVSESELNFRIMDSKGKLAIAERKFMQGKIRKNIFEVLASKLEEEILTSELALFRLQKAREILVSSSANKLLLEMNNPTKYRRAKINSILKETSLLRNEMSLLEGKLLKRQVREGVFEKLIAEKESKLISKEKQLGDIVESSKNN
ncbi:MAG: hypothetical protein WCI04_01780 [archaeon]